MSAISALGTKTVLIAPHGGELIDRRLRGKAREAALKRVTNLFQLPLSSVAVSDLEMIAVGAYSPLTGFMGRADYECVVEEMRLANGTVWSLPITLPVDGALAAKIKEGQEIALVQDDTVIAIMEVAEKFPYDKKREAAQVYQTTDDEHPGVARLYDQANVLLGGDIWLLNWPMPRQFPELRYTPAQTREKFAGNGWHQIVGFQTRNPLNRGHEHVLKSALKTADGLFLHPLVGETKPDDIPAEARIISYQALLDNYYPPERVLLGVFPAAMRYAGPREAILHALCRKNYGCTHFIVGRDHAGVGNYYAVDAACNIFAEFSREEIGIEALFYPEILYYCRKCGGVVTAKTCRHEDKRYSLNGTEVRKMLKRGKMPRKEVMRLEVSGALMKAMLVKRPIRYFINRAVDMLANDPQALKLSLIDELVPWAGPQSKKSRLKKNQETNHRERL